MAALALGAAGCGSRPAGTPAVARSAVLVVTDRGDGSGERGSGWVWDARRGLVVTADHVTAGGRSFSVGTGRRIEIASGASGALEAGGAGVPARLVGGAPCEDVALLRVRAPLRVRTLPRARARAGEPVVAVGYSASLATASPALDARLAATRGRIMRAGRFGPYRDALETSAAVNQGNSGGPLVDSAGRVVGMSVAKDKADPHASYAIAAGRLRRVVPRLLAGQDVCRR